MANPNPARITDASWWLMQELLRLQPGTRNGGLYANKRGYHNTRAANDANWPGDYSVRDAVDRQGPADKCAAYDWTFPDAQAGNYTTIARYTQRLLKSAKDVDDPRLNGWREFYGNADSDRDVEGWDTRYGSAASSDDSHLWHIHLSESRALVNDMDNKRALLSVLRGETTEEWRNGGGTDMGDLRTDDFPNRSWRADFKSNQFVRREFAFGAMWDGIHNLEVEAAAAKARDVAILQAVAGDVDSAAILARIDELAAAHAADLADMREWLRELVSGEVTADEVVAVIRERLGDDQ